MALKVIKAVWFVSLIIFLVVFMYNYASLPETVTVIDSEETALSISRDGIFYTVLAVAGILNLFVFVINKLYAFKPDFRAWFYGLIITLNIFLIISINFIALYNSSEKFDFEAIGSIIYGSVILVLIWSIGWPIYFVSKKIFSKQAV